MFKRLFAAIALPDDLRGDLAAFGQREAAAWPGASWTAPEDLHVTVVFLGAVAEARVPDLKADLARTCSSRRPVELEFSNIVLAPPRGSRRTMIWASFVPSAAFADLADAVRTAARPFAPEMPEVKAALPHATLARLAQSAPARGRQPGELHPAARRFLAGEVVLFESHSGSAGPRYRPLAVFKFSAPKIS